MSFSLKNLSTDQLYDHCKAVWKRAQTKYSATSSEYDFDEGDGRVNLLVARGFDRTKLEPVETNSNKKWDDTLFVVWQKGGVKKVETFEISTEQNTEGGTAVLVLGAHQYWLNFHKKSATHKKLTELGSGPGSNQYRALNPNTSIGVTVFRETGASDDNFVYDSDDKLDPGNTTINVHYGGASVSPAGWSMGCQVLRGWDRYKEFIKLVESDSSIKGTIKNELATVPAADGTRHVIYFLVTGDDLAPVGQKLALPVSLGYGHDVHVANVRWAYAHTELIHTNGYFPLGTNTVWHGGVHFRAAKGSPVVACAPGRIVAARLGGTDATANGDMGSRNFILIRHELEGKPAAGAAPAPAPAAPAPAPASASSGSGGAGAGGAGTGGATAAGYKYTLDEGLALEKELREAKPTYGKKNQTDGFNGYGGHGDDGDKVYRYVCTEYTHEVLTRAGYTHAKFKERINIWPTQLASRHTGSLGADSSSATLQSDDLKDKEIGKPAWVYITSGTGNGAVAAITSLDAATGTLTLAKQVKKGTDSKNVKKGDTFRIVDLEWSVLKNETPTKGMVYAMVEAGLGTEITDHATLRPGDFLQYWYYHSGSMAGHAVQIKANKGGGSVDIHSSHGSTWGIDTITIKVTDSWVKRWYAVRPNYNPSDGAAPAPSARPATPPPAAAPPPPSGLAWYSLYMHLGTRAMMSDNAQLEQYGWLARASAQQAAGQSAGAPAGAGSGGGSGGGAGAGASGGASAGGGEFLEVTKLAGLYSHPAHAYVGEAHPGARFKKIASASDTHWLVETAHNGTTVKLNAGKRDLTQVRFTKQVQYSKPAASGTVPPAGPPAPALSDELLARLGSGSVVKLDVPIGAGEALWVTGEYGPPDAIEGQLHWSVFAAEQLFPGFTEVEDTSDDFTMDCQQIMEMVEQSWFGRDDVLDAEEIQQFYRTKPEASRLRFYACKFVCEWGVDLAVAIPRLKNVWFTWGLEEQLKPYMWWDEAVAARCVLPTGKRVWHYNPIAAVAFLAKVDFPPGSKDGQTISWKTT